MFLFAEMKSIIDMVQVMVGIITFIALPQGGINLSL